MGNTFGGQSGSQTQTTTSTTAPWAPFQPYLVGGQGTTGIWPQANGIYNAFANPSDQWNDANNRLINTNTWYSNDPIFAQSNNNAESMVNGGYNANITPVTAQNVSPAAARASQGALDPTNALGGFLNGTAQNPYVAANAGAVTDLATRNALESVFPNIASGSEAAGQYGGTRQGIAEGLALSHLNQDLAPSLTGMYSNASENALNRQLSTASGLNDQAVNIATGNANRNLQTDFQNNAQAMQNSQLNVANAGAGLNLFGQTGGMLNNFIGGTMSATQNPANYAWGQLGNYANMIYPGMNAGQESTSTQTSPVFSNPFGSVLGGVMGLGGTIGSLATPGAGGVSAFGNMFG